MRPFLIALCILALISQQATGSSPLPFMTFTNTLPGNRYVSDYITSTDQLKLIITWPGSAYFSGDAQQIVDGVTGTYGTVAEDYVSTPGSFIFEKVAGINGRLDLSVQFDTDNVISYNLQFFVNGILKRF